MTDGSEPNEDQPSVLVCHRDPARRRMAAKAAEAAGLRDVGEVESFLEVLAMVPLVHPDVILLDRTAAGFGAPETLAELVALAPTTAIVVLTDEPSSAGALTAAGATAAVQDADRVALDEALTRALAGLAAERGAGAGRRTGEDRRKHQDWSKVTSERRTGDRRAGSRRSEPRDDSTER